MQPDTTVLVEDFKAAVRALPEEEQDAVFHDLDDFLDELEGETAEPDDDDEADDDDATALAPDDNNHGTN